MTRAVQCSQSGLQTQQRRCVGDLPVHNNKQIEQWATFREHIPMANGFKFDTPHLRRILIWAVAAPALIFTVAKTEFNKTDTLYDRKKREFM